MAISSQNQQIALRTNRASCTGSFFVPPRLPAAQFPGHALPIDIDLQLVVDGHEWGERFSSCISALRRIGQGHGQRLTGLVGGRVEGLRRGDGGPAAIDLLISSPEGWAGEQEEEKGSGEQESGGEEESGGD
jgi:hypothetical protein